MRLCAARTIQRPGKPDAPDTRCRCSPNTLLRARVDVEKRSPSARTPLVRAPLEIRLMSLRSTSSRPNDCAVDEREHAAFARDPGVLSRKQSPTVLVRCVKASTLVCGVIPSSRVDVVLEPGCGLTSGIASPRTRTLRFSFHAVLLLDDCRQRISSSPVEIETASRRGCSTLVLRVMTTLPACGELGQQRSGVLAALPIFTRLSNDGSRSMPSCAVHRFEHGRRRGAQVCRVHHARSAASQMIAHRCQNDSSGAAGVGGSAPDEPRGPWAETGAVAGAQAAGERTTLRVDAA